MANINLFDGGLNIRSAPHLLKATEALELENVDLTDGTIKAFKKDTIIDDSCSDNIFYNEELDKWENISKDYDKINYKGRVLFTEGSSFVNLQTSETTSEPAGISTPSGWSWTIYYPNDNTTDFDPYIFSGEVNYAYTWYDENTGTESPPCIIDTISAASRDKDQYYVDLKYYNTDNSRVTHVRLYRIGQNLTDYTLVKEFENDTDGGESDTYTDNVTDLQAAGNIILYTEGSGKGLVNAKYLTEHNSMLFSVVGSKVQYTDIGRLGNWGPYNFIDVKDTITGLGSTSQGLLAFTSDKTYIITGMDPKGLSLYLLDGTQGCADQRSIVNVNKELVWLSNDGICISNGDVAKLVSLDKLGKFTGSVNQAAVYDNIYYLAMEDKTILADFRRDLKFSYMDTVYKGLYVYKDVLYGTTGGNLVTIGTANTHKNLTYKSPDLHNSDIANHKMFDNIKVDAEGDLTITIYIDNNIVKVVEHTWVRTLEEIIPDNRYGMFLNFKVEGTGTLYGINFDTYNKYQIFDNPEFMTTTLFPESYIVNGNNVIEENGKTPNIPLNILSDNIIEEIRVYSTGSCALAIYYDGDPIKSFSIDSGVSSYTVINTLDLGTCKTIQFESSCSDGSDDTEAGKIYKIETKSYDRDTIGTSPHYYSSSEFKEVIKINSNPMILNRIGEDVYTTPNIPLSTYSDNIIRDFYITYKGSITLEILLDDVVYKTLNLSNTSSLSTEQIDLNDEVCKTIKFKQTVTSGKIYDINYNSYDESNISKAGAFYDTEKFIDLINVNGSTIKLNKTEGGYISDTIPLSITHHKMFKSFIIAYKGELTFKLYLDGAVVKTVELNSDTFKVDEILLNSALSRAYYIRIEIIGTKGKVYEIEINPLERQTNGR